MIQPSRPHNHHTLMFDWWLCLEHLSLLAHLICTCIICTHLPGLIICYTSKRCGPHHAKRSLTVVVIVVPKEGCACFFWYHSRSWGPENQLSFPFLRDAAHVTSALCDLVSCCGLTANISYILTGTHDICYSQSVFPDGLTHWTHWETWNQQMVWNIWSLQVKRNHLDSLTIWNTVLC